jgi:hypothetical protein
MIPKKCSEDTTLVVSNEAGDKVVVPILKGTGVYLDVPGLHYNRGCSSQVLNHVHMTTPSSLLG